MRGSVSGTVLLIAVFSTGSAYAADLGRQVLDVSRALRQNPDLLKNVSAYTCLETISRQQEAPKQRKPRTLDAVQVDVAVGQGREIYSWPGAAAFNATDLAGLVGTGFVATGFFDALASNVFVHHSGAAVRLAGEEPVQGTNALRFTYVFPSWAQKWNINWLGAQGGVGTSGEFWVDSKTFTLLRLDAVGTDIPANLPLRSIRVAIDYRPLPIGSNSALILSEAEIVAIETNGTRDRDVVAFSECHTFTAESTLSPSEADLTKIVQTYEAHREALPAGLNLSITLETPINTDTAKVGDALRARLDKAVKISPALTVPRGASVQGRIRQIRKLKNPPNTREVGLSFDEIDWPGHVAIFFAEPEQIEQIAGLSRFISEGRVTRGTTPMGWRLTNSTTENVWVTQIPGVARFFLTNSHTIPKGFRMTWRTSEASHP